MSLSTGSRRLGLAAFAVGLSLAAPQGRRCRRGR